MARPKKPEGEKYETRTRQVGRVDDETWSVIQAGADAAKERGDVETFSQWAITKLSAAAKRELRK